MLCRVIEKAAAQNALCSSLFTVCRGYLCERSLSRRDNVVDEYGSGNASDAAGYGCDRSDDRLDLIRTFAVR